MIANDSPVADLVRAINANGAPKAVIFVSGGGTEVFPILLAKGGGSSTLLAGRIPYDPADFRAILGCDPGRLADSRAARGLAMAAYRHALTIRGELSTDQVFGVGATSKLSRGPGEREGRLHEVYAVLQTDSRTLVRSVTLPSGATREWEERINSLVILNLLAIGKGIDASCPLEHDGLCLPESAVVDRSVYLEQLGNPELSEVLVGRRPWSAVEFDGSTSQSVSAELPRLLLPGSFRPVHAGHLAMAEAASRLSGHRCDFEISLFHPDKLPLDYLAIRSRLSGFAGRQARVYLTDAPTYRDKARLFPDCTFVVGHDTAERIVDPRYYGGSEARDAILAELESLGARFLIFGRVDASGQFRDFTATEFDSNVAGFLERASQPVPESMFRHDLSSTQVREQAGTDYD